MIEELKYSLRNLIHRRLRSFLTVLSILIGITAIFAILSFGLGINEYIDTLAQEAGIDKLYIQAKGTGAPGTDNNFYISEDDIDYVSKINGVNEITGLYMSPAELKYKNENNYYFVAGINPEMLKFIDETFTVTVDDGRHLKEGDLNKVVLGYNYKLENEIFNHGVKLGDKVELNDIEYEVIGFYEEVGNPGDDSQIYVTKESFETLLYPESKDKYGFGIIRADQNIKPSDLAEKITEKLRKHKGLDEGEEDFFVQTFEDAIATFTSITDILNGILALIALISLIVASINIMNTMYTAVLERTREIGVMKSIGATNKSILMIFIFESGFLGLVGGILGVIFGWIVAKIGGNVAANAGYSLLQPSFPWYLIVGCLLFAFSVGTIAGLLPAKQASKLKPVDALRYE
jgi:putative ABC transport system permease protein